MRAPLRPTRTARRLGLRTTRLAVTALAALAPLAAVTACRDTTSPQQQAAGTYTLRSVAGQPLPVVVSQDASGTTTVAADTLTLNGDGTASEHGILRVTPADGGAPATRTQSNTGTWTLEQIAGGFSAGRRSRSGGSSRARRRQ